MDSSGGDITLKLCKSDQRLYTIVMNSPENPEIKPVAYDAEGRPLYHHPPESSQQPKSTIDQSSSGDHSQKPSAETNSQQPRSHVTAHPESIEGQNFNPRIRAQYANEPRVVHATRDNEPKAFDISPELKARHEASQERYPHLNLSEAEFVILDIKRHPIGMLLPIGMTVALLLAIFAFTAFYPSIYDAAAESIMPSVPAMIGIALLLSALVVLGGAVALWVYLQNQFFMTNESVIQEIQESLFSRHEQTVSLGSIEDASFRHSGILQTVLDYGTIRLSTEGEETTYTFKYVQNPRKQIAILTNAIEAFKNGRPVDYFQD